MTNALAPGGASLIAVAAPTLRRAEVTRDTGGLPVASGMVASPARLLIPAIGVDTSLGRVGLNSDGSIEVPSDWYQPAWFTEGPPPGAPGPAVIVGHLDSLTGPAVFWHLAKLRGGDEIQVVEATGAVLRFRVATVGSFPHDRFPTDAVYGATPDPGLRLITCAGVFDWSAHRYSNNVVVFAQLQ